MTAEFIQHQQALARFAGRLSSGRGDLADDILQQTFLQAWRNKHRVDYSRCCKSWLMRIMKNEFLQITRKNRNHEELCEDTMPGALELTASPLSNFEFLDLIQSISDLSVDQRQAIILVLAYGYTYDEAARMIGCRSGTVKSRVARGRINLTRALTDSAAA